MSMVCSRAPEASGPRVSTADQSAIRSGNCPFPVTIESSRAGTTPLAPGGHRLVAKMSHRLCWPDEQQLPSLGGAPEAAVRRALEAADPLARYEQRFFHRPVGGETPKLARLAV